MHKLTSFKLSGHVSDVYIIETEQDLQGLPTHALAIGAGSNAIIHPDIQRPLVRVSPAFCDIQDTGGGVLLCSAGMMVSGVLKWMFRHGYTGLEFAAGVPATLGGMVYMNFECWGHQFSDRIHSVLVQDHHGCRWVARDAYQCAYRWTSFHDHACIILAVKWHADRLPTERVRANIAAHITERKSKQPLSVPTFGSVFKNAPDHPAGRLIDAMGLKGHAQGDARVSLHHANFIENTGSATFDDTVGLIESIQNNVFHRYNIQLACEVQIIT